jgi:hypothetical protein
MLIFASNDQHCPDLDAGHRIWLALEDVMRRLKPKSATEGAVFPEGCPAGARREDFEKYTHLDQFMLSFWI